MNPLLVVGLLIGGAVAISLFKTAKAAVNLNYNVVRFGIYKFASDGAMVLRCRIQFGNLTSQPLTVNMIDLAAYYKPTYSTNPDGTPNIVSRGNLLATLVDTQGFVIPANGVEQRDFFINVRWADIGKSLLSNITNIISIISNANGIADVMTQIIGAPVLISGGIKAENMVFNVSQIVSLSDDRQ